MAAHRTLLRLLAIGSSMIVLTALPHTALAAPLQVGQSLDIPWWVWLLIISVILLVSFIGFVWLAWRDSSDRSGDEI